MNDSEPVPFLKLTNEFEALETEWFEAIRGAGSTGQFILGPQVQAFESEMAAKLGVEHAVGLANGTDALVLSLKALGIGPGDEVITTPYTFFATVEAIMQVGATPVFVDIQSDSFNLDPSQIPERISARTKAILPVHLFGRPADMAAIMSIAKDYDLKVIEDAAQAFGAKVDGQPVGSIGHAGCFSFYPTKVLGCYGDGGMVSTNEIAVESGLRHLRNHCATQPFIHDDAGYNSRLDEIQAALLRIKLRQVDEAIAQRQRVAATYDDLLSDVDVVRPARPHYGEHVFNLYTIKTAWRDGLRAALTDNQIASSICYPLPLQLQQVCQSLGYKEGDLPVSEQVSSEALSLPIFPDMTEGQIERVCQVIRQTL